MDKARIDSRYSNLIRHIYAGATLRVKIEDDMVTEKIPIERGVRQGDTISPKLFILALEDIFKSLSWGRKDISIDGTYLNHLRFSDDVVLISTDPEELKAMFEQLHKVSKKVGLKISSKDEDSASRHDPNLTGKPGSGSCGPLRLPWPQH